MKIRIKDSTIRMRLSQTDIKSLYTQGEIISECRFGTDSIFRYSINTIEKSIKDAICAYLVGSHIKVEISKEDARQWYKTDLIGFEVEMDNGSQGGLQLLLEKDWKCMVDRDEDQTDLYPNPNEKM